MSAQNVLDSLTLQLEKELANMPDYDREKQLRINAYKKLAEDPAIDKRQRYTYYLTVVREFEKFSFDSTLFYIEMNLEIARELEDDTLIDEARLYLSATLGNVGRNKEAEDELKQINVQNLSRDLFIKYSDIARKLFENLSYYAITAEGRDNYKQLYITYRDTLLSMVSEESEIYLSIVEKDLLDARELDDCLIVNTKRLSRVQPGTKEFSLINFQRSLIYELKNDLEKQKINLMISAISDIQASVKDNAALASMAALLYKEDKIERAYQYIQNAYKDAVFYNSRLRFLEISRILSLITASYQQQSDNQKSSLKKNLIVISILSAVLFITVILIYRQVKKLSVVKNRLKSSNEQLNYVNKNLTQANGKLEKLYLALSESNHVKEQYIGNFLKIHSEYIDKLDRYQKVVKQMLRARKYEELYKRVNSTEVIDAEVKEFYETFDNAFLSIYPDFLEQFNQLLQDGEHLEVKEGEILNTELRIFALIRLGIKDSSKIARLLRYSVNTIYNYRVKIKNKAKVPRDEFEDIVQSIDAFQNT
ncbi:MAG: DUF6377 domain-containing protein [Roseivirga sp.]